MSRWSDCYADEDARDRPREKFTWSADPSHAAIARLSDQEMDAYVLAVLATDPVQLWQVVQRVYQAHRELEGSGRVLEDAVSASLTRLEGDGRACRDHYSETSSGSYEYRLPGKP